ncbi:MAG: glycogen/starch synthase [bacterium]
MNKSPIKVLFVSAEAAPFAKVGGLADVAGALPPALKKLGVDIRIMMPLYGNIEKITDKNGITHIAGAGKKYKIKKTIENLKIKFGEKDEIINIYQINFNGAPFYFIDNENFLKYNGIYENENKFLLFNKAIADIICQNSVILNDPASKCGGVKDLANYNTEFILSEGRGILRPHGARAQNDALFKWKPDIIHCNDNHTALIPLLLKNRKSEIKTVLTIHNLEFQGAFSPQDLKLLEIYEMDMDSLTKDIKDGDVNKMAQGILCADVINTVSPTYAKEILTKEYGEGLENILKKRKKDLYGIINGIDTIKFNPEKDPFIKYHYSAKNLDGKKKNKKWLLEEYFKNTPLTPLKRGIFTPLLYRPQIQIQNPLIALISRLTSQKGIDLVIAAIPQLFKKYPDALFILLGAGDKEYEKKLKELSLKYPENFKAIIGFDLKIAQEIYAGSDIFLMPSRFEPCGLGQLTAMRYGTVPVVRKTGGLADTVENFRFKIADFRFKKANGFMFEKYSSSAMMGAIDDALRAYQDKKMWKQLMTNGMRRDSSWDKSAKEYVEIYKKILKIS